jgi:hypothetical protein
MLDVGRKRERSCDTCSRYRELGNVGAQQANSTNNKYSLPIFNSHNDIFSIGYIVAASRPNKMSKHQNRSKRIKYY